MGASACVMSSSILHRPLVGDVDIRVYPTRAAAMPFDAPGLPDLPDVGRTNPRRELPAGGAALDPKGGGDPFAGPGQDRAGP